MFTLRTVVLAFVLVAATSLARAETRVALVIGNANYQNVGHLANPANDAMAVAGVLRRMNFSSVDYLPDLGYDALRRALIDFSAKASRADVALVYYAGHGIEADHRNYLVPVDARLATAASLDLEAVPLENVLDAVEGAHRLRIVILDACRNNPFAATMSAGTREVSTRGLARVEPSNDTLVVYSAKDGTTAQDGAAGANSPFALALVRDMPTPGLEINLLFRKVHDDVMAVTHSAQQPFVYGSLSAQAYYFVPPAAPLTPQQVLPALDPKVIEKDAWDSVKDSGDAAQLQSYLEQYPHGAFSGIARAKIAALGKTDQAASLPPQGANTGGASHPEATAAVTANSTAAPTDLFAFSYGNTIRQTMPDGRTFTIYVNPDKTWEERNGSEVVKGTYRWKDDTHVCFTLTDPLPADPGKATNCSEIKVAHKLGETWIEMPDGKTAITMTITAGRL